MAGLNLFANPVLFAGGTVLVMLSYDPGLALELLTRPEEPVTHFPGVPAYYQQYDESSRGHVHIDVLDPVDDPDVAVGADHGDVTGVQPAVLDRLRRRVRPPPVPRRDAGPGDPQLARLAGGADPAAAGYLAAQVPHRHADVPGAGAAPGGLIVTVEPASLIP